MLRLGFIASKFTEVIGISNKEFWSFFEKADSGTICGIFKLRRAIPTYLRDIDVNALINTIENRNKLPKTNLQKHTLFEYYFNLALNDPEVDMNILIELNNHKKNFDFKKFFIEVLTISLKLQNNLKNKTLILSENQKVPYLEIDKKGKIKPYISKKMIELRKLNFKSLILNESINKEPDEFTINKMQLVNNTKLERLSFALSISEGDDIIDFSHTYKYIKRIDHVCNSYFAGIKSHSDVKILQ